MTLDKGLKNTFDQKLSVLAVQLHDSFADIPFMGILNSGNRK
jgi:hypothetical protein